MDEKWTFSALKNTMPFSLGSAMLFDASVVSFFFFFLSSFFSLGEWDWDVLDKER